MHEFVFIYKVRKFFNSILTFFVLYVIMLSIKREREARRGLIKRQASRSRPFMSKYMNICSTNAKERWRPLVTVAIQ